MSAKSCVPNDASPTHEDELESAGVLDVLDELNVVDVGERVTVRGAGNGRDTGVVELEEGRRTNVGA